MLCDRRSGGINLNGSRSSQRKLDLLEEEMKR